MKMTGIKKRWMLNGIAIIIAIVAFAVAAFTLAMYNYYFTAVKTGLEEKARTSSAHFTTYVSQTYAEFQTSAYRFTEGYDEKDIIELQFINTRGRIETSSFGIGAGTDRKSVV